MRTHPSVRITPAVPARSGDPASGETRVLLTVEEAARRLRIGRTTCYRLVATGQLATITIGHLRRVPVDALAAFVRDRRAADAIDTH
ncbi:MAG: helix-turn-helix domain-containing protein [Frankiales bacterium]|nr:helix-turn-helix domain-containing protein [Frankiales bacterium]